MSQLFDFINGTQNKVEFPEEEIEEGYLPFVANRHFSFEINTIFYAADMNQYPSLTKKQNYDYYFYSLPRKKFYIKWMKKDNKPILDNLVKMMNVSYKEANEILPFLTEKQIKEVEDYGYD